MTTLQARALAGTRTGLLAAAVLCLLGPPAGGAARAAEGEPPAMPRVRVSGDGRHFVLGGSGKAFVPWGFNYLGEFGKLTEDSWDKDWPRVERDFRGMRKLGANVVRVHLQFGTYMTGPDRFDPRQLDRLKKMLDIAREEGLYLDVTGLSCYRLDRIPAWYDALDEAERWEVQARWWKKIAEACAGHPAVFCYDLMNEPVVGGVAKKGEPRWVGGELGGFHFVQRISEAPKGRTSTQIAEAWVAKLTRAIRQADARTPITVGVIPWAQIWPNARPVFYAPEVARHLDFVSVHVYPGKDKVGQAIAALAVYDIGKPLVVEETFPLNCTMEEMDRFVEGGKGRVDGWISHYFGHTIEEHRRGAEPVGTAPDAPFVVKVADFLEYWRDRGRTIAGTSPEAPAPRGGPPKAKPAPGGPAPALPAAPTVRGSVEQIHVVNAGPGARVTVRGRGGYRATAPADDRGGLVIRGVPPGDGYAVTVEGSDRVVPPVRVLGRDEHPAAGFYSSQKLDPTRGYVKTRDGTLLSYRVVLPDPKAHGKGPYDLVVTYSGYQPGLETADAHQNRPFEQFSALGYAVAGVNVRGSGCSGGAFDLMEPLTWLDGYDAVEAFAAQPWVDDVALGDQSWPGLTQLFVASTRPPSLKAIVAGSVVGDFYRDVFYPGGIPNVGFGHVWAAGRDAENAWPSRRKEVAARAGVDPVCLANQALRGQNVNLLRTIKTHPYDGSFWQGRSAEVAKIKVPTLQIVSWQDPQVGGRPAILSERFAAGTPVRLVGVNGFHQYYTGAVWDEIVRFLDTYLGDAGRPEKIARYEAQNRFLVLLEADSRGKVRGRFTLPSFAAAGDGRRLHLGADLRPGGAENPGESSTFTYDPARPGSWAAPVQGRATFTSEDLPRQTVMAGSGSADLWVAADAEDVDLQVTLSEVRPDGQEMLVQSGWLRASHRALDETASTALRPRHRHTAGAVEKLAPRTWTLLRVELFPFAHVFRAGSRVRLTVSGPGGGSNAWPWAFDALRGGFAVRIAHDGKDRSSSVVLPVVEPQDLSLPPSLPARDAVWLQPCRTAD